MIIKPNFIQAFRQGIAKISQQNQIDNFHCQLYFAYAITLMGKYLADVFIHEIATDKKYLVRLSQHPKFMSETLKIPFLLYNSVEDYLIGSMKNIVWHRLSEVEVFYRQVLQIEFNLNRKLLEQVQIRHHLVHRNGFDNKGNAILISETDLMQCIDLIANFIEDIEKKYQKI